MPRRQKGLCHSSGRYTICIFQWYKINVMCVHCTQSIYYWFHYGLYLQTGLKLSSCLRERDSIKFYIKDLKREGSQTRWEDDNSRMKVCHKVWSLLCSCTARGVSISRCCMLSRFCCSSAMAAKDSFTPLHSYELPLGRWLLTPWFCLLKVETSATFFIARRSFRYTLAQQLKLTLQPCSDSSDILNASSLAAQMLVRIFTGSTVAGMNLQWQYSCRYESPLDVMFSVRFITGSTADSDMILHCLYSWQR
jgi:hypothetical protein